jgi:hypothetical protein
MKNRMVMGAFRYQPLSYQKSFNIQYDNLKSIRRRLKLYELTGNLEHLVDCANICMIEFMVGNHEKRHFKSIDDGEHAHTKS